MKNLQNSPKFRKIGEKIAEIALQLNTRLTSEKLKPIHHYLVFGFTVARFGI